VCEFMDTKRHAHHRVLAEATWQSSANLHLMQWLKLVKDRRTACDGRRGREVARREGQSWLSTSSILEEDWQAQWFWMDDDVGRLGHSCGRWGGASSSEARARERERVCAMDACGIGLRAMGPDADMYAADDRCALPLVRYSKKSAMPATIQKPCVTGGREEAERRQLCVGKRVLSMRSAALLLGRGYGEGSRGCVLNRCLYRRATRVEASMQHGRLNAKPSHCTGAPVLLSSCPPVLLSSCDCRGGLDLGRPPTDEARQVIGCCFAQTPWLSFVAFRYTRHGT
jgi:hypothetical protein